MQRGNHRCSRQGKRERCRCTIVVTPCGRGSRPGGRHATRGPAQVGPWWLQVGMVSLPGWGGTWERRERLGSNGSEISRNRYNLGHPGVHQTARGTPLRLRRTNLRPGAQKRQLPMSTYRGIPSQYHRTEHGPPNPNVHSQHICQHRIGCTLARWNTGDRRRAARLSTRAAHAPCMYGPRGPHAARQHCGRAARPARLARATHPPTHPRGLTSSSSSWPCSSCRPSTTARPPTR